MGHLICIKPCYNSQNESFKVGSMYRYYDDQYLDMMGTKYYYIYEVDRVREPNGIKYVSRDKKFGSGRMEFLNIHFVSVVVWGKLLKQVDLEFDKFLYDGFTEFHGDDGE